MGLRNSRNELKTNFSKKKTSKLRKANKKCKFEKGCVHGRENKKRVNLAEQQIYKAVKS